MIFQKIKFLGHLKLWLNSLNIKYLIIFMITVAFFIIHRWFEPVVSPFIFGDESSYFNLIHDIAVFGRFNGGQYGPLYPFIGSFLFDKDHVIFSYFAIKTFNILIFCLSIIPWYLLSGFFVEEKIVRLLLCALFVFAPLSTLTTLIWAEPFYFFIYAWVWYFCAKAFHTNQRQDFFLCGLLISCLFLTKPAGLIPGISFLLTQALFLFFPSNSENANRKSSLACLLFFLAPLLTGLLGYISYNWFVSKSTAIGYATEKITVNDLADLLDNFGFYNSFLHQISYFTFSLYAVFLIVPILLVFSFRNLNVIQVRFAITILASLIGVSTLISVFFNLFEKTYHIPNDYTLANGRYLGPLYPPFILVSFWAINHSFLNTPIKRAFFLIGSVAASLLVACFSPLLSAYSMGVVNSPDVMFVARLYLSDVFPWQPSHAQSLFNAGKITIPLLLFLSSIAFFYLLQKQKTVLLLCLLITFVFYASTENKEYIRILASTAEGDSTALKYFIENKIDLKDVYFLNKNSMDSFKINFWYFRPDHGDYLKAHTLDISSLDKIATGQWIVTADIELKPPFQKRFQKHGHSLYQRGN